MHRGYIKIWRKLEDSGLLQMHGSLAMFIHMLMEATHKPIRYGTAELERGQLVTGRHKMAETLGLTDRQVRTCESNLRKLGFVTSKSTNKYTIYTIVNYNKYQDMDNVNDQQIDKQTTNDRQTNDKQPTTIQEHKHINTKEHNKKHTAAFALPDWVNQADWDLWMRTRKGKKMIPDQMQAQIDKMGKWKDAGMDYGKALHDAATAGWQGLFEPKQQMLGKVPKLENFDQRDYGSEITSL